MRVAARPRRGRRQVRRGRRGLELEVVERRRIDVPAVTGGVRINGHGGAVRLTEHEPRQIHDLEGDLLQPSVDVGDEARRAPAADGLGDDRLQLGVAERTGRTARRRIVGHQRGDVLDGCRGLRRGLYADLRPLGRGDLVLGDRWGFGRDRGDRRRLAPVDGRRILLDRLDLGRRCRKHRRDEVQQRG